MHFPFLNLNLLNKIQSFNRKRNELNLFRLLLILIKSNIKLLLHTNAHKFDFLLFAIL